MKEEMEKVTCDKQNELIAFLYGELDGKEAETFQRHLHECACCRTETNDLRDVREVVVGWRNESLAGIWSSAAVTPTSAEMVGQKRPSAMAALRQFFDLSPLWMKGAVACASLLFCLFAGLAIARLRESPPPAVIVDGNRKSYSEQELQALVDQRVQAQVQQRNHGPEIAPVISDIGSNVGKNLPKQPNRVQPSYRGTQVAAELPSQKARRPLSRTEREQLAADLRLVSAKGDELDLLGDRFNE